MPFDMNNAPSRKNSSSPYSGGTAQARSQRPDPAPKAPPHETQYESPYERQDDRPAYGSSGFQNMPGRRDDYRDSGNTCLQPRPSYDDYALSTPVQPPQRRDTVRRPHVRSAPRESFSIPWNTLVPIIGVLCAILFLYLYRNEISAFLSQILSWVFTIVVIVLIFKLIFRRR